MRKDVCIIVAAQGISEKIVERFKGCIDKSKPNVSYDVVISGGEEERFYKTRILNKCLRNAIPKYKVIIQTDIDLVVPPRLIDRTFRSVMGQPNNAFHHHLRYVDPSEIDNKKYKAYPWRAWTSLKTSFCSGCWNGMLGKTWEKSRGYNEDMFAWGSEDTEFYNRSRRLGIRWINCKNFPLVHINHKLRQKKRPRENFLAAAEYDDQTNWLTGKLVRKVGGQK